MSTVSRDEVASISSTLLSVTSELKPKQKVLEEEEYLDRMSKIIKRDFFSSSETTGDTSSRFVDPGRSEQIYPVTPGTSRTAFTSTSSVGSRNESCSLRLDEFLDKYTSEDNAYFEKLQKKELTRHRLKFPWLYGDRDNHNKRVQEQIKIVSSTEKSETIKPSQHISRMIDWPYNPKNSLFYPKSSDAKSRKSQSTVNYRSTKYMQDPIFKEPFPLSVADKPRTINRFADKIGVDGKSTNDPESHSLDGHSLLPGPRTPILRQDITDDTVRINFEPKNTYFIPSESPRDELARRLYDDKVAKNIRTPKSERSGSARGTPRVKDASPNWRF